MRTYYFTEMPYPDLPPAESYDSARVTLPNRVCDPMVSSKLYNRYLTEWEFADAEGLEIMVNEHHQTPTCINAAAPLILGALARTTKRARLLVLGNPIANRRQPVRVAEEMAMIDCMSYGRLDCGFIRGVPFEVSPANSNPVNLYDRFYEALDLIVKAWTTHDGPFSHEGRYFHHRMVNIWPRPYQQPHPPIWITGSSDFVAIRRAAARGFVFATFLQPHVKVKQLFDAYRSAYKLNGQPGGGGTAFMPLVYVADTESEAEAGMKELIWYMQAKTEAQYRNPPGYAPVETNVQGLKGAFSGRTDAMRAQGLEFQRDQGVVMYGTPDQLVAQVKRFYDLVGGFDHLLMMMQAGFLDHKRTVSNIKLFAKEVYPRIKDLARTKPVSERAAAE